MGEYRKTLDTREVYPIPNHKRTTTLSLRIDSELYEKLKNESDENAVSINSLVVSMIQKHSAWDIFAKELGFTTISKTTLSILFEQIPPEKLKEIAKNSGFGTMKELILLMFGKIDFETIIEVIKIRASLHGMLNHRITSNEEHILTIHHGVSQKFGDFLAEIFMTTAEEHGIIFRKLNSQPQILSFSLKEN